MTARTEKSFWLLRGLRFTRAALLATALGHAAVGGALLLAAPLSAAELRIGTYVEPTSIDPHFWGGMPNVGLARHFFDHLIARDRTQQFSPGLAVSWRALDDTTWEFKLRQGVKWHDGTPFTAADVVATMNRIKRPDYRTTAGGYRRFLMGKEPTVVDDHTLHVKTEAPYPLMIEDMANFPIVPKAIAETAETTDFNSGKAAIGTGPYRFVEWVGGDRIVMAANPGYWGGKPAWDRIVLRPIKSGPARVAALLSGDVDLIDKVPTTDIPFLMKDQRVDIHSSISNRVMYLHVDSAREVSPFVLANDGTPLTPNPLRDTRVRKALSKAINRAAIVERVMEGSAIAAGQLMPEGFFGYSPNLKVEPYDRAGAQALLKAAGYPDGFRLTIHGPNDRYVNDAKVVEAIAQMWTQAGVRTEVVTQPVSVYSPRATALEYSIILFGYGAEAAEASSPLLAVLATFDTAAGTGVSNRGRYSNPAFDKTLAQAVVTMDRAKRERLLQEATEIAINDVGIIPLHSEVNVWGTRKGITYEARTDETTLAQSARPAN
jgi:peptide/nickel transport system substrate-binding protein